MADTASHSVPEARPRGRGPFCNPWSSTSFDYMLDRIERLKREVGRLKEEMRQGRAPGASMLTTLAPLRANIDSAAGASLEARIDRAPLSRSDVARRVDRLNRQRSKRG